MYPRISIAYNLFNTDKNIFQHQNAFNCAMCFAFEIFTFELSATELFKYSFSVFQFNT